jgi:hypothetical protein
VRVVHVLVRYRWQRDGLEVGCSDKMGSWEADSH